MDFLDEVNEAIEKDPKPQEKPVEKKPEDSGSDDSPPVQQPGGKHIHEFGAEFKKQYGERKT